MKIEIFETSLCCPTGVCGSKPDNSLVELQNTIQILSKAMIEVKRYTINQNQLNPVLKYIIDTEDYEKLPITLLNHQIIKKRSYPTFDELATLIPEIKSFKPDSKILGIYA